MRRPGWTGDQLIHPDKEAIAADNPDREDRPDENSQHNEREEFLPTRRWSL